MAATEVHPVSLILGSIEVEARAFFVVTHAGSPGHTFGLPEDCYPPEPAEIEIRSVVTNLTGIDILNFLDRDANDITHVRSPLETGTLYEQIEIDILENADLNSEPDYE